MTTPTPTRRPAEPKGPQVQRYARYLVSAYCDPSGFSSPQEYLAALTEGLDELTFLHGQEPPDLSEVKW